VDEHDSQKSRETEEASTDEKDHLLLQLLPFLIVILVVKKNLLVDLL